MDRHTSTPSVNGDCIYDNEASYQDTGVYDCDGNMLPDLLDSQIDSTLKGLDMGAIKKNSYERTRAAMAVRLHTVQQCISIYEGFSLTYS